MSADDKMRELYIRREETKRNEASERINRERWAEEKGREEGIEIGARLGEKRGIEKGRTEGIALKTKEAVFNMKAEGFDIKIIAKCLSISESEVEEILRD